MTIPEDRVEFGVADADELDDGVEQELSDGTLVIDRPFDPSKIKVTTEKKNIDLLVRRIDHGEVDLAPEFQRRARVWPIQRKSQLIESLLLRIPLPVFYVSAGETDDWAVVDGLQRITTIYDYLKGGFSLQGLEYLTTLEGKLFQDLDRSMKRRIEETELVINVIQPGTPEEVMINIFKRINTGGLPLNGQEIRNALNKGPVREYLKSLASDPTFISATDNSIKDNRMAAQEMALRFLAFSIVSWQDYKVNDLDAFLNEAMRKLNTMSESDREKLRNSFQSVMVASRLIFNDLAFRKPRFNNDGTVSTKRNQISKPLFEAWSLGLASLKPVDLERAIIERQQVVRGFHELMLNDSDFVTSISYSTGVPGRVSKRFKAIEELLHFIV
ncbi:DUF262 domain-containing protein [Phyllobacterium sp. P30BS-XVII]|uniref:DUF262 domain-containing protein n=1 Tax=Phyllobacterium sp. P30BS-XVII TaxID=2587046 RepID=UPI0015FAC0FC|nr:DUF262 domain-containing protein [Phyllobacterium sp. P30BS-XVII]MBA8904174.1 hypothetical protein [Phyllobacterium sp. P30BS-XVII]